MSNDGLQIAYSFKRAVSKDTWEKILLRCEELLSMASKDLYLIRQFTVEERHFVAKILPNNLVLTEFKTEGEAKQFASDLGLIYDHGFHVHIAPVETERKSNCI